MHVEATLRMFAAFACSLPPKVKWFGDFLAAMSFMPSASTSGFCAAVVSTGHARNADAPFFIPPPETSNAIGGGRLASGWESCSSKFESA